jgi:hypothetical protein
MVDADPDLDLSNLNHARIEMPSAISRGQASNNSISPTPDLVPHVRL